MADWSAIETALEAWVTSITGLSTHWNKRPTGYSFSNVGYALLSISGRTTRGNDDVTSEYDDTQANGEQIRYYQSGQRQFTFTVQVRTSRQSVDDDAKHYTSLLRDAVALPTRTAAALAVADLSFARIAGETDLDVDVDGRELSVSNLDLVMNASAITEDTKITFIETVDDAAAELPEGTEVWSGDIPVG